MSVDEKKPGTLSPYALSLMKVEDRPIPHCPRCGFVATENSTAYGPRAECCGLWSWNRMPLADAKTHQERKALGPLFSSLSKALGSVSFFSEMRKRTDIKRAEEMTISAMNEVTARRMRVAAEDLMMDMMAGKVVANAGPVATTRRRS